MSSCRGCELSAKKIAILEDELKTSHEDRDFVKTLWRQVQAEHGDVGAIVNTVLDRVTKQNEEKDRSVLHILQDKDNQISSLQSEVEWTKSTLDLERKEMECVKRKWGERENELNDVISQLEEQIAVKDLVLTDPVRQSRKCMVEKLDHNKSDLEKQLQAMQKDLQSCGKQIALLKKHHEEQVSETARLQTLLESRDSELDSHKLIISELKGSIADRKEETSVLRQKLEFSEDSTEKALRALEKSEKVVRDTQHDLLELEREQHAKEKHNQKSMDQLHTTISKLEGKVAALVAEEKQLRSEYEKLQDRECGECVILRETLESRDKEAATRDSHVDLVARVRERCVKYLNRPIALRDIPDVIDIVLADVSGNSEDIDRCSKLIKQLQLNCHEKDVALEKMQEVHDKRLERMSSLQDYLSEVLDEMKIVDTERWKELNLDFRDVQAPQPLRHEDSETVWVDLQHYKGLCSKMRRQLAKVEEENDKLKLQRVADINTFNDMKAAILLDQQECEKKLRVANHQSVCGCNLQLEILRDKMSELSEQSEQLNSENIRLLAALHTEQSKVAKLESCQCELRDRATQTVVIETATVACETESVSLVPQKESSNFKNTLNLLDKLTQQNQENIPPPPPIFSAQVPAKTPVKVASRKTKVVNSRCTATQTISQPPVKVLQKPPAAMKIRMASLNQQVAVLTKAKHRHAKEMAEEEGKVSRLEGQLSAALKQVTVSQNLVAGLNEDVRVAHEEAQALRDQIQELQTSGLRQSELAILLDKTNEIKKLNHQNNLLTAQVSSSTSAVTKLKAELEDKMDAIMKLEEKLSRSERVVRQQRSDADHLRSEVSKHKSHQEELHDKVEEMNRKLRKIQDLADNRKNYIETLKAQLSNAKVNLEQVKGSYEDCKINLENKGKELKNLSRKQGATDKMVADLQELANHQLEDQEKQFHRIEEGLQKKVNILSKRNLEWEKCIRQAIKNIVSRIKQERDKRVVSSSLSSHEYDRAKHLSSSILQLSEADFHDIMSSTKVNSAANESGSNIMEVWKGQLAKILSLDDFGPVLANSLEQLFEEYAKVLSGEVTRTGSSVSLVSGHSLTSTENTPVKLGRSTTA